MRLWIRGCSQIFVLSPCCWIWSTDWMCGTQTPDSVKHNLCRNTLLINMKLP